MNKFIRVLVSMLLCICLSGLSACGTIPQYNDEIPVLNDDSESPDVVETEATAEPTPESTPEPTPEPTPTPIPDPPETLSEEQLANMLIIGDSRMETLHIAGYFTGATYQSMTNMHVYTVLDAEVKYNGAATTLRSMLANNTYKYIFISLGVNDCGYPIESFRTDYNSLLQTVTESQPDSLICVQNIYPVDESNSGVPSYTTNAAINEMNGVIEELCEEYGLTFIDVTPVVVNEEGVLSSEVSKDGIHVYYELAQDLAAYTEKELAAWIFYSELN